MVATPADVVSFLLTLHVSFCHLTHSKISWSSCKDGETSSDTFAGGVAVGAMSYVGFS